MGTARKQESQGRWDARPQDLNHCAILPALQLSIAFLSTEAQRNQVISLMSHSKAVAQLTID